MKILKPSSGIPCVLIHSIRFILSFGVVSPTPKLKTGRTLSVGHFGLPTVDSQLHSGVGIVTPTYFLILLLCYSLAQKGQLNIEELCLFDQCLLSLLSLRLTREPILTADCNSTRT